MKKIVKGYAVMCESMDFVEGVEMNREDAEQWVSFLMKLYGQKGTFLLGDPLGGTARGSASTSAARSTIS